MKVSDKQDLKPTKYIPSAATTRQTVDLHSVILEDLPDDPQKLDYHGDLQLRTYKLQRDRVRVISFMLIRVLT